MFTTLFILICSLLIVTKGATIATKYAALLAESFHLSRYTIGFIVIAIISILPETFVALNTIAEGVPEIGLGTLFGSNIADLTLVFAIVALIVRRGLKVEGKILKNSFTYPLVMLLPLTLGLDGYYSRIDGLVLIIFGGVFYYLAIKEDVDDIVIIVKDRKRWHAVVVLLVSMAMLLIGSHYAVTSATVLAYGIGLDPALIGMFIIGIGTIMPELFFAIKSIKRNDDSMAIGDLLGTVLADATIVVGLMALILPFTFSIRIIYVTGTFMIMATLLLYYFMRSGRVISRKEAYILGAFWLLFVLTELVVSKIF